MNPQDKTNPTAVPNQTKPTAVPNDLVDDNGNPMYEDPRHPQYHEYLKGLEAGKDSKRWEGDARMALFDDKKYSKAYTKGVLQSLMNAAKTETNEATQRANRYNTAMAATAGSASGALKVVPIVGDWFAERTFDKIKNEAAATGYRMGDGGRADSLGTTAEWVTRIPLEIAAFKAVMGTARGVADKAKHIVEATKHNAQIPQRVSKITQQVSKADLAKILYENPELTTYAKVPATGVWGWISKHPKMLKALTYAPKATRAGAALETFGPLAANSVQVTTSRLVPSQAYAEWTGAPERVAAQMIEEQIPMERVDADIKEMAAKTYPNDTAKQQEYIRKAYQNLADADAPGFNDPRVNPYLDAEYYANRNKKDVGFFRGARAFFGDDSARQQIAAETLYRDMADPTKQKDVAQALHNSFSNMLKRDSKITDNEASQINGMVKHLYEMGKAEEALGFINGVIDTSIQNMDVAALEKLVEFGKRNGGGLEKLGLSPEHAKMLSDRVTKAAQNRGWALFKENPLENTPTLVSLWLQQKGVDSGLSEAVKNPWVFYGGSLALLLGGGALLGSLFQGNDDYDDEEEDYERPRRRRSGYGKGYTHFAQYA